MRRGVLELGLLPLLVFVFSVYAVPSVYASYILSGNVNDENGNPTGDALIMLQTDVFSPSYTVTLPYPPLDTTGHYCAAVTLNDGTRLKPYTKRFNYWLWDDVFFGIWEVDTHYLAEDNCPSPGYLSNYFGIGGEWVWAFCAIRTKSGTATTYYSGEVYGWSIDSTCDSAAYTLSLPYNIKWTATTSADGYYSFSNLDSGTYTISASKTGYSSCSPNPVQITTTGNNATVNFCLTNITNQPLPQGFPTVNNSAELSSTIPYIGPQLGLSSYSIYMQSGADGFNLTIKNFGDATANNTYGNATIFGNETEEIEILNNASIDTLEEKIVWLDTNLSAGKYNMTVSLDYTDPVVNESFSRDINATLIVGNVTTPVNISIEPMPVFYETQSILDGLDYLINSQNVDGGWGDNGSDILTTAVVMDALITANASETAIDSGFNYTESKLNKTFEDVGLTARMVLHFLKANRSSSRVDEAISWLETMENSDGGHGYNEEYRSNAMDTLLAAKVIDTGSWLMENIENGTWNVFDEADILLTAEAMRAISGDVNAGELNLSETTNFLKTQENLTFIEKCGVLSALSKVNYVEITEQLRDEIESNQSGDGSFGSIAQTAYAVSSLMSFYSTTPPRITILSPQNISYNVTSLELNYSVNRNTSWTAYSLDGQPNVTLVGNTTLTNLSDDQHYVTVYANDTLGNMGSAIVYFTVNALPDIVIWTDKASYTTNDTMHVGLNISNPDGVIKVGIYIWVDLPNGSKYWVVKKQNVTLPEGLEYSNPVWMTVTLPSIAPGNYSWHGILYDPIGKKVISESIAPWTFSSSMTGSMKTLELELQNEAVTLNLSKNTEEGGKK